MSALSRIRTNIGPFLSRPSVITVGIALAVTLAAGVYAEYQNRLVHHQRMRAAVSEQLGLVRARLEGNINSNIQLVRGLVAVIATEPDIDQQRFGRIADSLFGEHSQLRNIAAAPDLIVKLIYPVEGNEKALGLNYLKNVDQRDAALRAVESGDLVLAGPVDLLQGGRGFIGRFPVFEDDINGGERFWGLVSAVVDIDRLYLDSGLYDDDLAIDIAISGKDAVSSDSTVFHGSPGIFENDPVVSEVALPTGSWHIAATPRGGWTGAPDNVWQVRALTLIGGLLLILPISTAGFLYDQRRTYIRELAQSRSQLQKVSQRLKMALQTSQIGVWELDLQTGRLQWDERMKELYGAKPGIDPNEYDYWASALHPEDRERAEKEFSRAIATNGTYRSDFRVMDRNGGVRWIRTIGAVHSEPDGNRVILGVNWDVSADIQLRTRLMAAKQNAEYRSHALEEARALMERNSLHDSLTGLPNRRFLDERVLKPGIGVKVTAMLHVDLDRFKHINDTLGHAAGDAMLVHAAEVLKANIGSDDIVARIGGDEFVIVTTSETDETRLSELADRIVVKMRQPVPYGNHECRFGVSIGVALANPDDADYRRRLLIDADIALYRAKSKGRNRFEFFSVALKAEIIRNKRIADDILGGLERQEFLPHFQPQFDARTLEVVGVEALARWQHPLEGLQRPEMFLGIADELNVVPLLDRTILEQTLWQATRWKTAGISIPRVSVNVSAGRLNDPELIDRLEGLAIEPNTMSFELLESIFLDEGSEVAVGNMERLREMGIDIEIDDFGTGYASIVSLINLRPARMKIDRRLVKPIVGSRSQRRLVASIIEIGLSLGIKAVAEGVETTDHAVILRDLGCDVLQGYAFAAPMSSDDLMEFIREERWREVA